MSKMCVPAGIVTFNPDIRRLHKNLSAIRPQVSQVLIFDNGSRNSAAIAYLVESMDDVTLLANGANDGISHALNTLMAWASQVPEDWIVLLDQDSVAHDSMVVNMLAAVSPGVGAVVPVIEGPSATSRHSNEAGHFQLITYAITSGGLYNTSAWKATGGYDESLFIDFVDFDYCVTLASAGYEIRRATTAKLSHEVGQPIGRGRLKSYNYPPNRLRHMGADMLTYSRKHRHTPLQHRVFYKSLAGTYGILLYKALAICVLEKGRYRKLTSLFQGIAQGRLPSDTR